MMPAWIYAAVAAALLAIGGSAGSHWRHEYDVAQENKAAVKAQAAKDQERARMDTMTAAVDQKTAFRQEEIRQQNQAVYIEVPKYVTKTITLTQYVHAARVLNDAAATGVPLSAAAGATDDSPDDAESIAEIITQNIGQCRADLDRFAELQQWVGGSSGKMTFIETMLLLNGSGVLAMGVGIFKWSFGVERHLTRIETLQEK